jgi:AcrR family transcriptional regulator
LFAQSNFEGVTIAKMAQSAGVAKGTAYLYFSCKEAVFLELLQVGLDEWASALHSALQMNAARVDPESAPTVIARTLAQRPVLGRLLVLLHTVIEPQLNLVSARAFKGFLHDLVERLSASLVDHVEGLNPSQAAVLVLQMHALVISVTQLASPPPVIARVLQEDARLHRMAVSFEPFLALTLSTLLRGTLAASTPTN